MKEMKYIYGPVPSRRLGVSLGVSPIPKKTCNFSCIYCQIGRTSHLTNKRQMFFRLEEIINEFTETLKSNLAFDVVTIVGEGEPTLYSDLGKMICEIKNKTDKPVAVITNGSLLNITSVQSDLSAVDIVLSSIDAYDEGSFRKINRPHRDLKYEDVRHGLEVFSQIFQGQLWLETMLIDGINDDDASLEKYAAALKKSSIQGCT